MKGTRSKFGKFWGVPVAASQMPIACYQLVRTFAVLRTDRVVVVGILWQQSLLMLGR